MKNQIKFLAALAILGLCLQANAQVSFGIHAGGGIFNFDAINAAGDEVEGFKFAPKYNVGFRAEFSFANDLAIQAGLIFATKGPNYKIENAETIEMNYSLNYLEFPLNFVYKTNTEGGAFFVGGGPYLGYGLSGDIKMRIGAMGQVFIDVKFGNEYPPGAIVNVIYLKTLDYGLNTVAGYQLDSGLFFSFNAQVGLANMYVPIPVPTKSYPLKSSTDKTSRKNLGFGLSVGYSF